MQKILLLSLIITLISSCTLTKTEESNNTNTWKIISEVSIAEKIQNKEQLEAEAKKQKIETIRNKLALKWLILKWDINLENGEYTSALVKYLKIHKEIPNDKDTIKKLWDVYYNLKKFDKAYSYYSQVKDYDGLDKDIASLALIYSKSLNTGNIEYINNELDNLWLWKEQLFYYKNSIICIKDYSLCRQNFQNHFKENKLKDAIISTWTWESIIESEALNNIEDAFENYENFQLEDLWYKWALISWAFYENWLYPVAIDTAKILLIERSDYKPLLKLIAKSYFELWNYVDSKLYLIEYNKLIKDDNEASYFLWVVYSRLHEYMLSSIHFKKALRTWYENTYELNKRLLINYYELGEIEKMLEIFRLLLKENKNEITIYDYDLAIYYHIVNEKLEDSKVITKEALRKFPESEIFDWYMWWILMEEINEEKRLEESNYEENGTEIINNNINLYLKAEKYIDAWLELNSKSPMLTLVKWKIELSKGDIEKAFIYFKKTVSLDNNWDFWKIAKKELNNIKVSN